MYIKAFTLVFSLCCVFSQNRPPAEFWNQYDKDQKIAFINGAYGAISKIKSHHKLEVKKQYLNYKNWVQPYYIERFYEILDEHRSKKIGYKKFQLIDEHNVDGDFIESKAFAFLAIRSFLNLPISFPNTTGCKEPCTGGIMVKNY